VTRFEHIRCLVAENITHVLDCRMSNPQPELFSRSSIVHLQCGALDDHRPKLDAWFHRGAKFTLDALAHPNCRVLVHCLLGVSRGPSMTYAMLRLLGFSSEEAESLVRTARPIVRDIKYRSDAERAVRTWQKANTKPCVMPAALHYGPSEPKKLK
jgi:protein-tyrosine phosphatase